VKDKCHTLNKQNENYCFICFNLYDFK
jgi:hypothetical protein